MDRLPNSYHSFIHLHLPTAPSDEWLNIVLGLAAITTIIGVVVGRESVKVQRVSTQWRSVRRDEVSVAAEEPRLATTAP